MKLGVVGLGLIGGSLALGLRERHEVRGYDAAAEARDAARSRGVDVVGRLEELLPADAVIVATPLGAIVGALEALTPIAGSAVLIEVGSLKAAAAAFAARAPATARIVGLHPMAGSIASGAAAADPGIFNGRPFLVVPTARTDDAAAGLAADLARELGGTVTVCSVEDHDRAVAAVSALPLAAAVALARVTRAASPLDVDLTAGPGLRGATRLAGTSPELALALLGAPGLRDHLVSLRAAIAEMENALGDEAALRALVERAAADRPQD